MQLRPMKPRELILKVTKKALRVCDLFGLMSLDTCDSQDQGTRHIQHLPTTFQESSKGQIIKPGALVPPPSVGRSEARKPTLCFFKTTSRVSTLTWCVPKTRSRHVLLNNLPSWLWMPSIHTVRPGSGSTLTEQLPFLQEAIEDPLCGTAHDPEGASGPAKGSPNSPSRSFSE